MPQKDHICVCICTYKRPTFLGQLLFDLDKQETGENFDFSVVVVDNDRYKSARQAVEDFMKESKREVNYYIEPEQNIALARNKAIEHARGDFVAFIDDDEFPDAKWLFNLYNAIHRFNSDGILGPVLPYFEKEPPNWILKGHFFNRPTHPTGQVLEWKNTRTGNALIKRDIFTLGHTWFNPIFGTGGEDIDFFRRMINENRRFVWCNKSAVYEHVPTYRCSARYLINRALLRGKNTFKQKNGRFYSISKSFLAIFIYCALVPFTFIAGKHNLMKYLIKLCDHLGKILALLGLNTINTREMSD